MMAKADLMERARREMREHLAAMPAWSTIEKLALTCRILHGHGHDSGLAGQITARAERDGMFITQQWGLGFDEIAAGNLLTVDEDLIVRDGAGMANPANRFHAWIYRARPDVRCIVHTHPVHVCALSMLGRPLRIAHMDTCLLHEDVAFLARWPGVPVGNEEGEIIATALGARRAVLLAHHGLLVAGASVEEACMLALACEHAARLQLLAEACGEIRDVEPTLAREAHDWLLRDERLRAGFHHRARKILREQPECLG